MMAPFEKIQYLIARSLLMGSASITLGRCPIKHVQIANTRLEFDHISVPSEHVSLLSNKEFDMIMFGYRGSDFRDYDVRFRVWVKVSTRGRESEYQGIVTCTHVVKAQSVMSVNSTFTLDILPTDTPEHIAVPHIMKTDGFHAGLRSSIKVNIQYRDKSNVPKFIKYITDQLPLHVFSPIFRKTFLKVSQPGSTDPRALCERISRCIYHGFEVVEKRLQYACVPVGFHYNIQEKIGESCFDCIPLDRVKIDRGRGAHNIVYGYDGPEFLDYEVRCIVYASVTQMSGLEMITPCILSCKEFVRDDRTNLSQQFSLHVFPVGFTFTDDELPKEEDDELYNPVILKIQLQVNSGAVGMAALKAQILKAL